MQKIILKECNNLENIVLVTGITTTIRDFVKIAFLDLEVEFKSIKFNEVGGY